MPKKSLIKPLIAEYASDICPIFTTELMYTAFPKLKKSALKGALNSLVRQGIIETPWKSVYIFSPHMYFGPNVVHLREYLNIIMNNSGINYYVGLLDALHELCPSYKKTETYYQVMIDLDGMNGIVGKTFPRPVFFKSKHYPSPYIIQKHKKYTTLNVPTAELLAVDLISYAHAIGGLQESVNALKILTAKLDFKRLNIDIFEFRTASNIQRLGYIIENVLGMAEMAQPLHDLLDVRYNKVYARNLLASALSATHTNINKRWHLDVNVELKNSQI